MNYFVSKLFIRMLRAGEFHLLISALLVATASVTAISLFVERISGTLYNEASTFIAADALVRGSMPIKQQWQQAAKARNFETANFSSFNAMVFSDQGMKLGRVKAVDSNYPLYGELTLGAENNERTIVQHGPLPGEVWLAPRLISNLDIQVGDRIKIGNAEFTLAASLLSEPDNASTQFGVAPRAMIHVDDVERTGAIQVGSRVSYAFLMAGPQDDIEIFTSELKPELGEHYRLLSPKDGNRALSSAIDRAERFLLLSGSLSVLLSALAIAIAAQRFANKQQPQVALLKCLGVKPGELQNIYLLLLATLAMIGIVFGLALGWVIHHIILFLLRDLLPQTLAGASIKPIIIGSLTCTLCLFSFAGPPILSLKHVSPIRVLKQVQGRFLALKTNVVLGILCLGLLLLIYSQSLLLSAILLLSVCACIVLCSLFSLFILGLSKKLQSKLTGEWRIGLGNLQRQRALSGLQIFVFANIALLLLVLFQVRTNLIDEWKPQLERTPNHFVFNIFSSELEAVKAHLKNASIQTNSFYPMSRGRLIEINAVPIKDKILDKSRNNYKRELNLTWSSAMGDDNKIVVGEWWSPSQTTASPKELLVSAEQEYAEGLGLALGDILTFSIAGKEIDAKLASIRSVEWDSMNPNFFMIFNRAIAQDFAANWITSFYLDSDKQEKINQFSRRFPTVSLIELDQTLKQIKEVTTKVLMAVEFILLLVLSSSLLVVISSIKSSIDSRLKETALLRSFGASRRFTQRITLIEFASVGFIAGIFASAGAELSLYLIQTKLFESSYSFNGWMWIYAPIVSTLIIAFTGYLATVSTTHVPPMRALKSNV